MGHNAKLDELIERARSHQMSAAERRAQRVSLLMGLSSHRSTLTRETVEEILDRVEGHEVSTIAATKTT
jgi:poly-beta-hydroxyalkanoate depolymerase